MPNPFVHLELTTPDTSAAKAFYSAMFGWTFHDMTMEDGNIYSSFRPDSGPGGGIFTMPGVPTDWLPYIGVDDIHAATQKAVSLGAKVMKDSVEVPTMGWFSILLDPTGACIAIWQSKTA